LAHPALNRQVGQEGVDLGLGRVVATPVPVKTPSGVQ